MPGRVSFSSTFFLRVLNLCCVLSVCLHNEGNDLRASNMETFCFCLFFDGVGGGVFDAFSLAGEAC